MHKNLGKEMHKLCQELFPICRSITGDGFRQSLDILRKHVPNLKLIEIPTETKCFDWEVPKEWNIKDAYIITPNGKKFVILNNLIYMCWVTQLQSTR